VSQRDYPVITGVFLVVGVAVMLINLAVDLSYGLLDPRVRQG
jgi:peptide/nickel transport system permease protein